MLSWLLHTILSGCWAVMAYVHHLIVFRLYICICICMCTYVYIHICIQICTYTSISDQVAEPKVCLLLSCQLQTLITGALWFPKWQAERTADKNSQQ